MTNNQTYQTVNHSFENTGGNNMLLVSTVYLKQLEHVVYVMTDNDGVTMANVDFVTNELDWLDDVNNVIIAAYQITSLHTECTCTDDYQMYSDCYQEYIKQYCETYDRHMFIDYDVLPTALQQLISDDYKKWLEDVEQLVETDGEQIYLNSCYRAPAKRPPFMDVSLQEAKQFREVIDNHITADDYDNQPHNVSITLANSTLHAYDNAQLINDLITLVDNYIADIS